jgi:plasmid stabilization system protein ParE
MKYSILYLPVAEMDIRSAAMYIATKLKAPAAAVNLVREIRKKVNVLRDMPYMYQEYRGEPQTNIIYRVMPVKNYLVFYIVFEDNKIIEIHRVLYARMDINSLLS